jgi:tRNA (guanine37-N1)-methyltransferase
MSTMRFDIITIFPKVFEGYLNESMFKRAKAKKLVDIRVHDLRDYVVPRQVRGNLSQRRQVDDRPFGGGPGMVLKVEPIVRAIQKNVKKNLKPLVILTEAGGKKFDAKFAAKFSKEKQIIIVAGHYEGTDNRVELVLKGLGYRVVKISIGSYVLTGGELPAMVIVDAVSRHILGFLGKAESLEEKRYGVGVPTYTRPEIFKYKKKKYNVPKILLSGDHEKITDWRKKHKK